MLIHGEHLDVLTYLNFKQGWHDVLLMKNYSIRLLVIYLEWLRWLNVFWHCLLNCFKSKIIRKLHNKYCNHLWWFWSELFFTFPHVTPTKSSNKHPKIVQYCYEESQVFCTILRQTHQKTDQVLLFLELLLKVKIIGMFLAKISLNLAVWINCHNRCILFLWGSKTFQL